MSRRSNQPFLSSTSSLVALGVAFIVGLSGVVGLALASATGAFAERDKVTASVVSSGSQLREGSRVKFREVTVGRVEKILKAGTAVSATSVLELKIDHERMETIPANVTARVIPSTLFGENLVELVPQKRTTGATLTKDAKIPADDSPQAVQLETTFAALQRMAEVLQPAKLATVLGTLAQALDGRGPQLNSMIGRLDKQLGIIEANLPVLRDDVVAVSNFVGGLQTATPFLLDAARDAITSSQALLERKEAIGELIGGAIGLVSKLDRQIQINTPALICNLSVGAGLVRLMRQNLAGLAPGFAYGTTALRLFNGTFAKGPWGSVDVALDSTLLGGTVVPPPRYTPADRSRYPGSPGPLCSLRTGRAGR